MSNRTFDEIQADVDHAVSFIDADSLMSHAAELDTLDTPQAEALANNSRGCAHYFQSNYSAALSHFQRALTLNEELSDHKGMASATLNIGNVHWSTSNYPMALSHYHSALALREELGDRNGMASVMAKIGTVHWSKGDYSEALSHHQRALALHEELGDRKGVAAVKIKIGNVHIRTGDTTAALDSYQQSLSIYEELGDRGSVALVTGNIGNVYIGTGDYAAALSHYERALILHEEHGDRSRVAMVLGNIGVVHNRTGDFPSALSHLHRALELHEELGDRSGAARVTGNIGNVYYHTSDYPAALSHLHRALVICEEIGDRGQAAVTTGNIGNVHFDTSDYPAALSHFHRSLELLEELGDRNGVARVTGNIGNVYKSTGDDSSALSYYQRALALYEELGNRSGVAFIIGRIGGMHDMAGDYPAALTQYRQALSIHEELGERNDVAGVTSNILSTYVKMGSDAEAQQLLKAMDGMHIDSPRVRIERELQRSILQERSGDLNGSAASLQHALSEALEHGLRSQAAETHKALRDLALKQNNLAGYVEHNNEYTRITEEINGKDTATKLAMQTKQREIDAVRKEHDKHIAVLHSTLPKHIADRVARGETVNDHYENAAVIFLDIVGFTTISNQLTSTEVVRMLESVFAALDTVCKKYDVVKIKTIGDSYMAVAFPLESSSSEQRAAITAIDMLHAISHILPDLPASLRADLPEGLQVRIGLHSGPITAGVIGTERMQYDVWGDTVNVASRMESTSEPGRIHVSSSFAIALSQRPQDGASSLFPVPCSLIPRGEIEIKGKGQMKTFWLE